MMLNERKLKIMEAIITDYIATAEPIGSRTIAKKYGLGISSATIRNEMSDLEDLGLIVQPHASAGRIPSDKGYRLYVDSLMHFREPTREERAFLQQLIISNISQIDYLMQETAKALAYLTNYTTIVSEPKAKKTKIKQIQLLPLDEESVILVLVTGNKVVKNHILNVESSPNMETLSKISSILNSAFKSLDSEQVNPEFINKLVLEAGADVEASLLRAVANTICEYVQSDDNTRVYLSGVKNILSFPEFSDLEKAKTIFETLEEKELLFTLLDHNNSENIQIVIGSENDLTQMKDCSLIKANYKVGNHSYGSIGIIGPTRMDYAQVISVLTAIVKNINAIIKALSGG